MNSEDIKELSKLGLSSDQILAVIPFLEKMLSRDVTLLSQRQSRDRERQRKFRAKNKQTIDNEQIQSRDGNVTSQNTTNTILLKKDTIKEERIESKNITRMNFVTLPEDWKKWAAGEFGWSEDILQDTWQIFFEHWVNGKGRTTKREKWGATWRGWCRRQASWNKNSNGSGNYQNKNSLPKTSQWDIKRVTL